MMLKNPKTIEHYEWKKHSDIFDNIDIKINILCDQILFNPSEETVTITSCQLKDGHHIQSINHQSSHEELDNNPNKKENSFVKCNSIVSKDYACFEYVTDVICFGSTIIIFVLLFAILIFFLANDHDDPF